MYYPHPKGLHSCSDLSTDPSQTNDTQRLALQLHTLVLGTGGGREEGEREREGGRREREREREGGRKRGRERGRERGRDRWREEGREGVKS